MYLHANAKLGLAGRLVLVRAIEDDCSLKAAAAAFNVSPATAHRWWHRWLDGGRQVSALLDRSSRRTARRGCSRSSCSSGSATAHARPAGVRVWSRARPGSLVDSVWKVLQAGRALTPPGRRSRETGEPLRVALFLGLSVRSLAQKHPRTDASSQLADAGCASDRLRNKTAPWDKSRDRPNRERLAGRRFSQQCCCCVISPPPSYEGQ